MYHSITTSPETGAAEEELLDLAELVELIELVELLELARLLETPTPPADELLDDRCDDVLEDSALELLDGTDAPTEAWLDESLTWPRRDSSLLPPQAESNNTVLATANRPGMRCDMRKIFMPGTS
jgi:hypothetical protein